MEKIKKIKFISPKPVEFNDKLFEDCDFKEYNFYKGTITNCTFVNCNFEDANFSKATITNCKFIGCFMQYCGMVRINISNCEIIGCDLWHSNMCHSIIHGTIFESTILKALFKELNWKDNSFDKDTIIDSCGGSHCGIPNEIIKNLENSFKLNKAS